MDIRDKKAIIIGAGIGGLSTAIALRRAGMKVSVFERMPELREVGSGLTLWTNAMRALDTLGVADGIRSRGGIVTAHENRRWDGVLWKTLPIRQVGDKFGVHGYGVHRSDLQMVLAGALDKGTVQVGVQCTGFAQDGSGVTVRFAGGREERGDLLVGADGINSTVRVGLLGQTELRYSGYTCWRSAVKIQHELLQPTVGMQLYGPGSNFGIFPIGQGRVSWYGSQVTAAGQTTGTPADWKREAKERFRSWYAPVGAILEATEESGFVRQDIYDRKPVTRWGEGRVTLLGDAAHATTPALGQGGCMAIEDAVVLTRTLTQAADIPAALRQFAAERMGRTNGIVRQARRHGTFYHGATPLLRLARGIFFRVAPVKVAMREVEKLMGYEAR